MLACPVVRRISVAHKRLCDIIFSYNPHENVGLASQYRLLRQSGFHDKQADIISLLKINYVLAIIKHKGVMKYKENQETLCIPKAIAYDFKQNINSHNICVR